MQSFHVHKERNWTAFLMAVRSPLERALFLNMIPFSIGLQVIKIINTYDNYPLVGKKYTAIYGIL